MNYAEIKKNDIANGEGVRTSLFVSGCRNRCKNCFNAVTWDFLYGKPFDQAVEDDIIASTRPRWISGLSLLGGLALGVVLSKLAELGLMRVMGLEADMTYRVSAGGLLMALGLYGAIYLLILLSALLRVRRSTAIQLMRSEAVGEKPPRANWALALLGVLLLGAAYYLAVSIREPLTALTWFFAAVLIVIAATYLLFISGSVTLCRLLQRNPRFYYRKRHFVSVSSLVYRMKRNGAGLASICILGTMVLVMLSSTTCLYFGAEDSLRTRYPRAENVTVWYTDREDLYRDHSDLHTAVVTAARSRGAQMQDLREYRSSSSALTVRNGVLQGAGGSISDAVQFTAIPLSDYNAAMGARLTLSPGQVYICHGRSDYRESTLSFPGGAVWQVKGLVDNLASGGDSAKAGSYKVGVVQLVQHVALDAATQGFQDKLTELIEADGGTVTFAGYKGSYGNLVVITHDNGTQTYYGHNSSLLVSAGQKVSKGQTIARAGSTGRSTGTHCHFEVRVRGSAVNPLNYLR